MSAARYQHGDIQYFWLGTRHKTEKWVLEHKIVDMAKCIFTMTMTNVDKRGNRKINGKKRRPIVGRYGSGRFPVFI